MSTSKHASVWPLLLLFLLLPFFRHETKTGFASDELATLHLTAAIVEQQSLRIGEQIKARGETTAKVVVEGETYASVAPGLSFLSIPAYGAAKIVAWAFGFELSAAGAVRWLRLIMVQLPTAIFCILFFLFLVRRGVHAHAARVGVLLLALMVPTLQAATTLNGSFVAALCVLTCFMLLGDETDWPQQTSFVLSGLVLGVAIIMCREAVFALPLLAIYGFGRARSPQWLLPFFAFSLAGAVGVGVYNYFCFGSPFFVLGTFWGLAAPSLSRVWLLFTQANGLLQLVPVFALVVVGFVFMLGRGDGGESAILGLAAALALVFTDVGSQGEFGSAAFALALCVWPLARGIEAMGSVAGGAFVVGLLGSWSVIIATVVAITHMYLPADFTNPLRDLCWAMIQQGVFEDGIGHRFGLSGLFAVAPFMAVMFVVLCVVASGGAAPGENGGMTRALAVMSFAAALFVWQLSWRPDPAARERLLYTQEIAQRLDAARMRPDAKISRHALSAQEHAPSANETKIAVGHAATASGDNPAAIDQYRDLKRGLRPVATGQ